MARSLAPTRNFFSSRAVRWPPWTASNRSQGMLAAQPWHVTSSTMPSEPCQRESLSPRRRDSPSTAAWAAASPCREPAAGVRSAQRGRDRESSRRCGRSPRSRRKGIRRPHVRRAGGGASDRPRSRWKEIRKCLKGYVNVDRRASYLAPSRGARQCGRNRRATSPRPGGVRVVVCGVEVLCDQSPAAG
jgi:hypothetical protein